MIFWLQSIWAAQYEQPITLTPILMLTLTPTNPYLARLELLIVVAQVDCNRTRLS